MCEVCVVLFERSPLEVFPPGCVFIYFKDPSLPLIYPQGDRFPQKISTVMLVFLAETLPFEVSDSVAFVVGEHAFCATIRRRNCVLVLVLVLVFS